RGRGEPVDALNRSRRFDAVSGKGRSAGIARTIAGLDLGLDDFEKRVGSDADVGSVPGIRRGMEQRAILQRILGTGPHRARHHRTERNRTARARGAHEIPALPYTGPHDFLRKCSLELLMDSMPALLAVR